MADLTYGVSNQNGDFLGVGRVKAGEAVGPNITWADVVWPKTTAGRQGWYLTLPAGSDLVRVVSHGIVITDQFTRVGSTQTWVRFFGVTDVLMEATVTATGDAPFLQTSDPLVGTKPPNLQSFSKLAYALPDLAAKKDEIVAALRTALRVDQSPAVDGRLWSIYMASLMEIEFYCNHIMVQREMNFEAFVPADIGTGESEPYIIAAAGPWADVKRVESLTRGGVPMETFKQAFDGRIEVDSGHIYRGVVTIGPYTGGGETEPNEDIREALTRLVAFNYDAGIFQRNSLDRSGALEVLGRYVNRRALIV